MVVGRSESRSPVAGRRSISGRAIRANSHRDLGRVLGMTICAWEHRPDPVLAGRAVVRATVRAALERRGHRRRPAPLWALRTQRQWSDKAIACATSCLLALFSIVTLMAAQLPARERSENALSRPASR